MVLKCNINLIFIKYFIFSITDETLKQDIKLSSKDMGNNFVLATQVSKVVTEHLLQLTMMTAATTMLFPELSPTFHFPFHQKFYYYSSQREGV